MAIRSIPPVIEPRRLDFNDPFNPLKLYDIVAIGRQCLEYLAMIDQEWMHGSLDPSKFFYVMECNKLTISGDWLKLSDENLFPRLQSSCYPCPEAILKGRVNRSADVWSLGCVLYELFTGTALFPNAERTCSRELLGKMVAQIGLPTPEFLWNTQDASKYFSVSSSVTFLKPLGHQTHWQELIREARIGLPPGVVNQFIDLLGYMLRYERRPHPQDLLEHSLFRWDLRFHLSPNLTSQDVIKIYHACKIDAHLHDSAIPFPSPVFQFDAGRHGSRVYCHMQKERRNLYDIFVEKNGVLFFHQRMTILENQIL